MAKRPATDVSTFIVQPPVAVTRRVEPEVDAGTRYAEVATGAAVLSGR